MYFLQASNSFGFNYTMVLGTLVMLILVGVIILFMVMHQRKTLKFNEKIKQLEEEKQAVLLNASIRFQEDERNRIAADLHDDAGPLLATARLYLNENLVNQEKAQQLQSIFAAKQIIDDAILLIRNISHSLMPPTLKNFGLESAVNDMAQKLTASGSGLIASARFHDYKNRLKVEQELLVFRIIQELINNIIKHSDAGFIHITQNISAKIMHFRVHHDGKGIIQTDFETLNHSAVGLGLKNIASRLKVLKGKIFFEIDNSKTYYKVTIDVPIETGIVQG
jgi:two-component system, NarL family, sensor kinase